MSQISSATSLDQISFIFQCSVMTMETHNCSKYGEKLGFEYPAINKTSIIPFARLREQYACKRKRNMSWEEEKKETSGMLTSKSHRQPTLH